jgi:PPOX class probable F420-dependent enzyme
MLLTTFKRVGSPVSAPVRGLVDGDRAYFAAWSRSGTVKRLRHTDAVQVAPCTVLGLYSTAPSLEATARLLTGDEASRVAGKLADKYPARAWRRQMVHYELLPCDAADDQVVEDAEDAPRRCPRAARPTEGAS